MFKRWHQKSVELSCLRNQFLLFLLAAVIVVPGFGDTAVRRADKQESGPNDISQAAKPVHPMLLSEPNTLAEPNAPAEPNMTTPDRLELACGTSVQVKVVSVTLSVGGKERSWPRDVVRSLTLSPDGQAVLAVADRKQIPGILVRVLVSSQAGTMAFDRCDVRTLTLDVPPVKASPLPSDSPLLVQNLLLREAAIENLRQANQAALVACAQEYERPLAEAKARVDSARQKHKLADNSEAMVRRDLRRLEARQRDDLHRNGYSNLDDDIKKLQFQHRTKVEAREKAAVALKTAEQAQATVLKNKTDGQRVLYRAMPDAIKRVQAVAARHEFIMHSGGDLSERAMQKAFDAVRAD